jgi:hypothetical protein
MTRNIIQSPKLLRDNTSFSLLNGDWWFCADAILKVFDLPKSTNAIQFRAFREPAPGRWKIYRDPYLFFCWHVKDSPGELHVVAFSTAEDIFRLLGERRKTWYIEVYYWS